MTSDCIVGNGLTHPRGSEIRTGSRKPGVRTWHHALQVWDVGYHGQKIIPDCWMTMTTYQTNVKNDFRQIHLFTRVLRGWVLLGMRHATCGTHKVMGATGLWNFHLQFCQGVIAIEHVYSSDSDVVLMGTTTPRKQQMRMRIEVQTSEGTRCLFFLTPTFLLWIFVGRLR